MKVLKTFIIFLVLAVAAGAAWTLRSPDPAEHATRARQGRGGGAGGGFPVPVTASAARTTDVPVFLEGVGTIKALNTVTVRPQVEGRILSINFTEGQDVKKGDVLAKIDPATYQAQYDQAVAKKALDEALLANTRRDLQRYEKVGTLAQSQQQIDTQRALVRQQEAQVKADQAAIDNASAVLGYTDIIAPINGRTGIRLVDEGNLVHSGDATGIVVITEIQPISGIFTLPQQQLPLVRKGMMAGPLTAEAFTTDGKSELDVGILKVIDNQIDPSTGTVRMKADFPNTNLQLWPGQFVNVRLRVDTLKNVVVVPTPAVQRGPNGAFVYVVTNDNTATMRLVQVGEQTDTDAVIGQGLTAGEKVVTSGFGRLSEGSKVAVSEPPSAVPLPGSEPAKHLDGKQRRRRNNASIAP
jgi:multidrug efflux system membrane fusion protein